jgi:hypothetical protein
MHYPLLSPEIDTPERTFSNTNNFADVVPGSFFVDECKWPWRRKQWGKFGNCETIFCGTYAGASPGGV